MMLVIRKICLVLAVLGLGLLLVAWFTGSGELLKAAALGTAVAWAIGIGAIPFLRGYQYTVWIAAAVVAGMTYPQSILHIGDFDLRNKWLILVVVQFVMFGMGIQMSLRDFSELATSGKGVLVGLCSHFTIMPLTGFALTKVFHFDPEIAAGIILLGSCSSGLASNVMVYIARANLVLSVAVTAMTTLAAPFLTPFLMKILAGTLIHIRFLDMMMEIIKIVIVPIGAALIHDFLKTATPRGRRNLYAAASFALIWLGALPLGLWSWFAESVSEAGLQSLEVLSFFAGAVLVGLVYHLITLSFKSLDRYMPYVSMFGIIYFTTVTTAAGRDNLMQVGFLLFFVSVVHNSAGYFFGYWLSRLLGLDKASARTMAFEVGLQNGGMASGLAGTMGKLGTVGLAAAVFSPWMNISGSILANYWRKREIEKQNGEGSVTENVKVQTP
ncbi:bile acid:sodium symporter family protein [Dyadobacter sp. CY261]|uniref:bile acid:sodium symporter family protein n=1 Tax=Dyadobacter sp. CY261 TaxID=2907203 RepID=UPI001F2EFCD7|nr:bile acid:sodium symporter family protein [Dyadobacter sp. CY261]MCF0073963.1 bile acid:sodium symporter family protein [Dyadobacter sp. CY261]